MRPIIVTVLAGALACSQPLLQKPPAKGASRSNPYESRPDAERAGRKLYVRECASCHNVDLEGTSPAPALVSPALKQAPAGAIFWVLRNGSLGRGMPSFAHMPEQQRWQIVSYLQMRNK